MPIEPSTDKLRHDIDSGRTGDKVPFPDPSAAPLGTDDEAAGTPPTQDAIQRARSHEVGDVAGQATAVTHEAPRGYDDNRGGGEGLTVMSRGALWLAGILVMASLIAAVMVAT